MQRVGILGSAVVGRTLARGFLTHGYDVRIGSRTPSALAEFSAQSGIATGTFSEVAAWGDVLVLAVRGTAAEAVLSLAGRSHIRGKIVLDTTNPIADQPPDDGVVRFFTGPNQSLMEQLQQAFPETRLVKVFNSVGNARMVNPVFAEGKPTMFFCGNDAEAKKVVARVLYQFGWEPTDMGSAVSARAIEPLCQLWCIPGFQRNVWTHAFKVLWS